MNKIHPTVIIEGDVKLGKNNEILPYCVLTGPLDIGDNNLIGPHAVIGNPGEDTKNPRYDSSKKAIKIGSNNIIHEFSAIQKPCYGDFTIVGHSTYLMHGIHVPHDAIIEDKVTLTPLVVVGGSTRIMEGANIGIGATIHQNSIIGQYSMVAAGAPVSKNVKPFSRYIPGKLISVNQYAVLKYGFEEYSEEINEYVMSQNYMPRADRIRALIERYQEFHLKSGRKQY